MPDWVWSVIAMLVIGLVGWGLAQELDTERRLSTLEANQAGIEKRIDILSNKIVPLLKAR